MKHLFSYFPKLRVFRPWDIIFLSVSPLLLAYMYYTRRNNHLSIHSAPTKNRSKTMNNKLHQLLEQLKNENALIGDESICKSKIRQMMEGGQELLQVISDFDRTMSRYMVDGHPNLTCHEIIECYPDALTNMKGEHSDLRNQYYPIETDLSLTNDEKIPYMVEWWTKAHDVMVNSNIKWSIFDTTVKNCNLLLRIDCDKFIHFLNRHNVPLLIFSAGIGNVIDTLLDHKGLLFDNIRIVSNFMNFNKDGTLVGFQDSIIHSFNKSAKSIQDSEFYDDICTKRRNVILLGDSTGDPHMSDGLGEDANVLKIGFLNSNADTLMSKYMSIYDIVIVSDESFTVPRLILEAIILREKISRN